jgi:hypothetical protein
MNASQEQQFEKEWDIWLGSYAENGILYKAKDGNGRWSFVALPEICKLAKAYCEKHNGGYASQSAFSIVIDLMLQSGDLAVVRDSESQSQIPQEIADYIQRAESGRVSTFELRRRYMSDRAFRDFYDVHTGLASLATQPIQLTAQEYRSMPIAVVRRRVASDPVFKAAVDKLFASGQV